MRLLAGIALLLEFTIIPAQHPVGMNTVDRISQQQDNLLLAGHSSIGLSDFAAASAEDDMIFAELGDQIRLTGYHTNIPVSDLKAGETVTVDLGWQAVKPIGESYIVFLHVTDGTGNIVAQQDALPFDGDIPHMGMAFGCKSFDDYTLTTSGRCPSAFQPDSRNV